MKKIFITIIAMLLPLMASATYINGINYDLDSSTETATVIQGSYSGSIYIYSQVTYSGVTYTVTSIGEDAFRNSDITDVTIPNTVTSIGECSFGACTRLSSITIPSSVTEIGPAAFYGCTNLAYIELPSELKLIDENLFWGCTSLSSVVIPNGVTKIAEEAFRECSVLSSIIIPSSVTEIGSAAFFGCTSLKKIISEIQDPFAISDNVFGNIASDATLSVFEGTKTAYQNTAGWTVFSSGTTEILTKRTIHVATAGTLPQLISAEEKYYIEELTLTGELNGTDFQLIREMGGVIAIEYDEYDWWDDFIRHRAVYKSTKGVLKSLNLADSKIVSGGAVYDYENDGIYKTKYYYTNSDAFSPYLFSRTNIESIILPNSITSIGVPVFYNCNHLTSVTIPKSVTTISTGAFAYCNLTSIEVESGNNKYDSRNNCNAIIEKSTNTLIAGCKNSIIPNGVTSISSGAFSGCSGLTSITIPNSVTSIGEFAFSECSGLTSVTIPSSVTSIGSFAFYGCSGLTSVTIPNSMTSIGYRVFEDCSGLTTITIPNSVETIDFFAFNDCSGLTSILSLNNTPPTCDYSFENVNRKNCVVWVPKGCSNAYKEADGWEYFHNIKELAVGDVNLDGEVNQADLDATVDFIMNKGPEDFFESLADLNGDDVVDASDVVKLVTILNLQDGLSMDYQAKYSNQVISSLSCTLNNEGDKAIQLTKCELYFNQSLVGSSKFKVTLASGGSKKCSFDDLASYSAQTGFYLVWYYTYNGEDYTYRCEIEE